ncbi:hypothetical protein CKA38_02820 [Ereboglobus luteus]|uniref:Uncharacterized protein n=1 Tax=Ereboglobus luteus TaxID=1796921 RepID=A0A2U8E0J4_9BACT|nr:hypothetical protein CKA38_02820 [Ereboglobus luteus]
MYAQFCRFLAEIRDFQTFYTRNILKIFARGVLMIAIFSMQLKVTPSIHIAQSITSCRNATNCLLHLEDPKWCFHL